MATYNRTLEELEKEAALWWTEELKEKNALASVLPILLETQDDFLDLISLSKKGPFQIFDLIEAAGFPGNLFLKHLAVLSDYGGEPIQRLGKSFTDIFPVDKEGKYHFEFVWQATKYNYQFEAFPIKGLGNKKFGMDGKTLSSERELDAMTKDMIAILLFAATSELTEQGGLDKCEIGALLGNKVELRNFVQQRYILVSRIIGGATANSLGQFAQTKVLEFLEAELGKTFSLSRNGSIHLPGYDKKGGMPFDIVVSKGQKVAWH